MDSSRRRYIKREIDRSVEPQSNEWWKRPTEWKNYGDVNPVQHGGRFIRWEGNGWHVIETRMIGEDVPADIGPPEATHVMFDYYFYEDDVFQGGDPDNGLTSAMMRIVESLGDEMLTLNWWRSHPDELPAGEEPEYAPEFKRNIAYYVVDLGFHIGDARMDDTDDYWGYLESHGVERDEIEMKRDGGQSSVHAQTVADVPDDYLLVTDPFEVEQTLDFIGEDVEEYGGGGLFVKTDQGDYTDVVWFPGTVPYLGKRVEILLGGDGL